MATKNASLLRVEGLAKNFVGVPLKAVSIIGVQGGHYSVLEVWYPKQ